MSKAFTLIELLVVVLIIGILAAVALPQYQKAVDKAKLMGIFQLARSVKMAEEEYYLANGTYTDQQEDLSLSFSNGTGKSFSQQGFSFTLQKQVTGIPWSVYASELNKLGVLLIVGYDHGSWKGNSSCYAKATNERAKRACRSLTGSQPNEGTQYWTYSINF